VSISLLCRSDEGTERARSSRLVANMSAAAQSARLLYPVGEAYGVRKSRITTCAGMAWPENWRAQPVAADVPAHI